LAETSIVTASARQDYPRERDAYHHVSIWTPQAEPTLPIGEVVPAHPPLELRSPVGVDEVVKHVSQAGSPWPERK